MIPYKDLEKINQKMIRETVYDSVQKIPSEKFDYAHLDRTGGSYIRAQNLVRVIYY